jgi:hypothetical protein
VNFLYGSCESTSQEESGCNPPVQVIVFPACERNFSLYERFPTPDGKIAIAYEDVEINGVPGIDVDEGGLHRLELYTGDVTIVVYSLADDRRFEIARSLRPINEKARVAADAGGLPPPVPGAVEGTLTCSPAAREWGPKP